MPEPVVHLHLHTEFSILDGTVRIPQLMERCTQLGMPAVALTDQGNLFALIKFYKQALNAGIKPIIGVELQVHDPEDNDRPFGLVLLCQDRQGYRNLSRLVTRSYTEGQYRGVARVHPEWITEESAAGLICLSGARTGDVSRAIVAGQQELAAQRVKGWQARFGDRFYLEV
ncbi:MAG: PHP domain-containing protein, partial [Woeseiaceae bacterium]